MADGQPPMLDPLDSSIVHEHGSGDLGDLRPSFEATIGKDGAGGRA
jgi:hypothetical protein